MRDPAGKAASAIHTSLEMTLMLAHAYFANTALCAMAAEDPGGMAPALNHSGLKHGDSDLAIYKVLRDGVPDTSMAPVPLGFKERWQVVGYVRALQLQNLGEGRE